MIVVHVREFLLLYIALPFSGTHANDSAVTFRNSALVYQPNEDVEMEKEDLTISEDKVRVEYTFFNHGPKTTLDVAFPLPASPTFEPVDGSFPDAPFWDPIFETYNHLDTISGLKSPDTPWFSPFIFTDQPKHRPFANFQRTEDNKKLPYNWKIIALDTNGKDVTESLKRYKMPLSANYLNGVMDQGGLDLHPEFIKPLKTLGLLDHNTKTSRYTAKFQTQVIFYWTSVFPARKIKHTTHTYTPQHGNRFFSLNSDGTIPSVPLEEFREPIHNEFIKMFFKEAPKRKRIQKWINEAKQQKPQSFYSLTYNRIRYVLTTGKNWKNGRIKNFTLNIPIPKHTEVFVMGIQGLKKVGKTLTVSLKNFVPQEELNIFYIRKA